MLVRITSQYLHVPLWVVAAEGQNTANGGGRAGGRAGFRRAREDINDAVWAWRRCRWLGWECLLCVRPKWELCQQLSQSRMMDELFQERLALTMDEIFH